jgi:hypothetical protein
MALTPGQVAGRRKSVARYNERDEGKLNRKTAALWGEPVDFQNGAKVIEGNDFAISKNIA